MDIKDCVAIITGGASGLGAASAERLSATGARVVIADRSVELGNALAKRLGALFVETDVTSAEQGAACIRAALERFGAVHALVNCAGIAHGERVLGKAGPASLDLFEKVVKVNLVGTFNMLRLAAEAMSKNAPNEDGERGVIVATASVAAFDGQIGQAAYAASKAGIAGMTLPIARDLARQGIRMVTIAPGLFETPMMSGVPPQVRESLQQMTVFPTRLGKPAEYGLTVAQVIENPMLNGETIRLDGGVRLSAR
ncbi:MAG: SDR family NAD(P)-dependent oxidoreductase [Thermomonas sp.]|uniref:SDR family NAD(P)-dependent oxidoreductase n=1 Tax=Thermomonas sp. TaxID=1971895 RepID=UPI00261651FE|nr:SDR family NAD(P)-dependent oxidoreductase [Thermomonas sp.]MCC7096830.1 SDR family NAD(P)-dependent oxidoreductase [Thermomonas sp.]